MIPPPFAFMFNQLVIKIYVYIDVGSNIKNTFYYASIEF